MQPHQPASAADVHALLRACGANGMARTALPHLQLQVMSFIQRDDQLLESAGNGSRVALPTFEKAHKLT